MRAVLRASGLDGISRSAVLRTHSELWWPAYLIAPEGQNGVATAAAIKRMPDLFDRKMGGAQSQVYRLTPLGVEVRTVLERAEYARGEQ